MVVGPQMMRKGWPKAGVFRIAAAAAIAGVLLAVGLAGDADAGTGKKRRAHVEERGGHVAARAHGYRNAMAENGYNGYYERVLGSVPFGSQLWWRVYDSYPKGR